MDATHEPEEWRPVVGYEGAYEVSDHGRVRSLARTVLRSGYPVRLKGKVLNPWSQKGGYPTFSLRSGGRTTNKALHALVLEAFAGPRPAGMEGCHNDGDPLNNTPSNLRWGTRSDNMQDALSHGTHNQARKTHCKHGHEFTPENTRIYQFPSGVIARFCRACMQARRESDQRRRAA